MDSKENVGTTFVVTIPLQMDSNPKIKVQTNEKELNLSGKKALLVEDNEINLEIATIMLQDLGLIVTPAQNGKEALDIFEQSDTHTFDYIFMDPPYRMDLPKKVLEALKDTCLADEETLIIAEEALDVDFSWAGALGYEIVKSKEYKTNKHVFLKIKEA